MVGVTAPTTRSNGKCTCSLHAAGRRGGDELLLAPGLPASSLAPAGLLFGAPGRPIGSHLRGLSLTARRHGLALDRLRGGGARAARRRLARFLCPSLRPVSAHALADRLALRQPTCRGAAPAHEERQATGHRSKEQRRLGAAGRSCRIASRSSAMARSLASAPSRANSCSCCEVIAQHYRRSNRTPR